MVMCVLQLMALPSGAECDAPADANERCDQPNEQAAFCERCESRSPSCWGEREAAHSRGARSQGGALEMRARSREGALERARDREAARSRGGGPSCGPARAREDAGRPVKFLSAPKRLKGS